MLRELRTLFGGENPMGEIGSDFRQMLEQALKMTLSAGEVYLGSSRPEQTRETLYNLDVEINKLQRDIRKRLVAHLSIPGNISDAAFCLRLMSLVKDVERLGDYAKNVAEIEDIRLEPMPDDELVRDLRGVRQVVDQLFRATAEVFRSSDREHALELIADGRATARRCDSLIARISRSEHNANRTAMLVLGARYYKRINGHLLNILSSVVMPVHKLDYFDEDEIPKTGSAS